MLGRPGRDRDRQPAVLAHRDRRAGRGTRTHAGLHERARARCGATACASTSCRCCSGGLLGVPLAVWMAPRRALVPLAALVLLLGVYLAEGAVGASVVDRYLMGAATLLLPFCAVTVGGWAMLEPGSWLRRVWIARAAGAGRSTAAPRRPARSASRACARRSPSTRTSTRAWRSRCTAPRCKAQLRRCPLLSLPDNKLIPDARWILDSVGQHDIVARSQARADVEHGDPALEERIRAGSVAVYPLGSAVFVDAIVDVGDDPRDQVPLDGLPAHLHAAATTPCMQLLRAQPAMRASGGRPARRRRPRRAEPARRRWAWAGLALVLLGGLGLRLWGVRQGLPYAYNADEADHFVAACGRDVRAGHAQPALLRQPARLHVRAALPVRDLLRRRAAARCTPSRCTPPSVYTLARVAAAVLGTRRAVAAVLDRRAAVRPRRRAARGGDRGGGVPARLLRPPRAQRRPHAGAGDALAARHRGGAAQRPRARLPARGRRAGARVRHQVHRRDRARAAARGGRRAVPRHGPGERAGARWAGWRSRAALARWPRS